jgi:histidinol-phosphate aminotransferase
VSNVLDLARPELLSLAPYIPGDYEPDCLRLNANESPWRAPGDATQRGLNRYPPPRPEVITRHLSAYYGVGETELLVTRGSSEAIDVLIRGFCAAGRDKVLICPPTFDMYRLYAEIQGAGVCRVPLERNADPERDFALDVGEIRRRIDAGAKLIFICSPNNPTGGAMASADIEAICAAADGRSLVVIDEAYQEFSGQPSLQDLRAKFAHVVFLRTLSKFVSLAGVRCGAVIAQPAVIDYLTRVLPPYTFPTPSIELVGQAMEQSSLAVSEQRVETLRQQRDRMQAALGTQPGVLKVWPSDANFVLIQVADASQFVARVRRARILVRTFPNAPELSDCVRITIGRAEDNDRLLEATGA